LHNGQLETDIGPPLAPAGSPQADAAELLYLASLPRGALFPGRFRVARRNSPLRTALDPSAIPAWSAGMYPERSFGPFLDATGRSHWFDLFSIPQHVTVLRAGQSLLLLPVGTHRSPIAPSLLIPPGTVWILASQLTSGVPAGAWVGIRVKQGALGFPPHSLFLNDVLDIAAGDTITLEIELDPPTATGPVTGPGADATDTNAQLPATARFVFGPLGAERIDTAPASLSVYGNAITLARHGGARFEPVLQMVLIPMTAAPQVLTIGASQSSLYEPAGTAAISEAAWGLVVTVSQPTNLGTAEGCGFLALSAARGLEARWRGLVGDSAALGNTWIVASPTLLEVVSPQAVHFRAGMTFELWSESSGRRSTLAAAFPKPLVVRFRSQRNGFDAVGLGARVTACLDRPLLASGARLPVELDGSFILLQSATDTSLIVEAITGPSGFQPPLALALTNALLTVRRPNRLFVSGTLGASLQVDRGTLLAESSLYQVLPTLPDPYAANFGPRLTRDAPLPGASITTRVVWSDIAHPVLDISLSTPEASISELLPEPVSEGSYWMLDVSSAADQLGVSLSVPGRADEFGSIHDLTLHTRGVQVQSFLLPQFQWEPVHNVYNEDTGDPEGILMSRDDGGPAFLLTETVNLIPVAPVPVATELIRAFTEERAVARSRFTLPFGIVARAELDDPAYRTRPDLELVSVPFENLTGARQISLTAGTQPRRSPPPAGGPFALFDRLLAGFARQTTNFPAQTPDNTLGTLQTDFNNSFTAEIPITRIDLSGYGANIFSRWILPGDPDVGITQVSFDAFHGRAAFERILMVSYLWPCLARVIRTIVLERQGSGSVLRWDSGWIATTPGLFTLPGKFESIHPGVVEGMFDIREIRDTDQIFAIGQARVQAVYYDADVGFVRAGANPSVIAGQNAGGRVPARRQLGFVQRVRIPSNPGTASAALLSPADFEQFLGRTGPLGGPVDCVIRIGSSEQQMRITGIYTSVSRPPAPGQHAFAVCAYGSPVLPATGRWSVVRVVNNQTVQTADAELGVPLIRANNGAYRWADPKDLLHEADPLAADYAFLLSHDAQRLLFPRLKINPGQSDLVSDLTPKIADPYRMLRSIGIFPPLNESIDIGQKIGLTSGDLQVVSGVLTFNPGPQVQDLVDLSSWTDRLDYHNVTFTIDSLNNWQVKIQGMEQALSFDPGGEIFRIAHDAVSESGLATEFGTPNIKFPDALQAVTNILDMLEQIVPQAMRGGDGPLKFSCSFSGTTFRLSAVADFDIADPDGNAIDCGMGKVKGQLKVGGELTAELLKGDIHGAVFLEITGSWQQLIFPLIYGGGLLRFSIRADESGKTTFDLDACTVGSVGGDIIPGIIELEATVKYGYFIRFQDSAFQPGFVLGMEGRAKLLSGLLGFKLAVEGRVLIFPKNIPRDLQHAAVHLYGEILVAGSVTVAWLVDERKSFTTSFDVDVDWKTALLLVKTGLLPVP
jgi:hypothetical protein